MATKTKRWTSSMLRVSESPSWFELSALCKKTWKNVRPMVFSVHMPFLVVTPRYWQGVSITLLHAEVSPYQVNPSGRPLQNQDTLLVPSHIFSWQGGTPHWYCPKVLSSSGLGSEVDILRESFGFLTPPTQACHIPKRKKIYTISGHT